LEECVFTLGKEHPEPGTRCYRLWRVWRELMRVVDEEIPINYYAGYTATLKVENDGPTTKVTFLVTIVPGGEEVVYV